MLVDPHFLVKIMKGISRSIASKSLYIAFSLLLHTQIAPGC